LERRKKDFEKFVQTAMDENLKAQNVDRERMKEIRSELSEKELGREEKKKLQEEYRRHIRGYQKARAQTLQDKEIRRKRRQLMQRMKAAMQEQDPEAEQLLEELRSVTGKLQRMREQKTPEGAMQPGE
jgi:hypothetical protein